MQSVGSILREARDRKGLSMDDIIVRTRINSKNLSAIESDDVSKISSPFHYRSFVRQYALELDLDYEHIGPAVDRVASNMRQPDLPGQGEHPPVRVAPIHPRIKRDFSWMIPTAVMLLIVILGSGGFAAWKLKPQLAPPATTVSANTVQQPPVRPATRAVPPSIPPTVNKALPPPVPSEASATAQPDSSETAEDDRRAAPPAADAIHLELAATERTWLSVIADGKPAYSGILEPEETKVLDGQQFAKLRTGNAGGVSIIFNGKPLGNLGPRGTTRTVIFTKSGYEIQSTESAKLSPISHIGG